MTAKVDHTLSSLPGPYSINPPIDGSIAIGIHAADRYIANVWVDPEGCGGLLTGMATARLFAAAPDMAKALLDCLVGDEESGYQLPPWARDAAAAALVKAGVMV